MKLGKIYTFKNKEEAKVLIGKIVLVSDVLGELYVGNNDDGYASIDKTKLMSIGCSSVYPFNVAVGKNGSARFQFIREIIEDDEDGKLMTHRQLAEWLAKGNGLVKTQYDTELTYHGFDSKIGNEEIDNNIFIRSWNSDKWVEPTLDIYEKDCKKV